MTAPATSKNDADFYKLRYLIIDDFENFRASMRQMLHGFGASTVEAASNGSAAIQQCTYGHFDVVLCDFNLGEGKNGQHILEELRHRKLLKRSSLFLMVTAETSKEMVMGAREYQPDAYLTKPINRAMLEKRLGGLIAQRSVLLPINREIDLENLPEAISLCIQAIPKFPRYRSWLMKTLADLYYQMGDYSHARKLYDEVLEQRDLSWAQLGRSKVLLAEQSYDQAELALKSLIQNHPDFMEAYDALAETLAHKGQLSKAQRVLEKAVELSPNALLRQKSLAHMATSNQDIEAAAEAWRRTVGLGAHSIHDDADHYLALGRALSELSDENLEETGQAKAEEALKILAKMEKRFSERSDLRVKSLLIQSRVHAGQKRGDEATKCLDMVTQDLDHGTMDASMGLELAKTLFRLDRHKDAEQLLGKLAQRFESNPEIIQQIENLLDEPVGFKQKLKARSLTRSGIKAFEDGELDKAAETFEAALEIVPSHAALNLNLVQVRIKQLSEGSQNPDFIRQCQRCLSALEHIPEQHRQYRRYTALRSKLETLV
ncbi:tetratricopeptide repeat protein [Marinobacter caseinilyticus]|uniref:tetratricopeptide repeat protein n=1 Tax=Marinobacter caseinilyticus TaxID=2692195 RepID=UPI00140C6A21|nr:tetratricopeptide repeat protein [Marinobacter caseinilyticus]